MAEVGNGLRFGLTYKKDTKLSKPNNPNSNDTGALKNSVEAIKTEKINTQEQANKVQEDKSLFINEKNQEAQEKTDSTSIQEEINNAMQAYTTAQSQVMNAQTLVSSAQSMLSSAQSLLSSTPATKQTPIEKDGKITGYETQENPDYLTAQAAYQEAQAEYDAAQAELDAANSALEEANSEVQTKQEALNEAQEQDSKDNNEQEIEQFDKEYESLQETIKDLDTQIDEIYNQIEAAEKSKDTEEDNNELQNENETSSKKDDEEQNYEQKVQDTILEDIKAELNAKKAELEAEANSKNGIGKAWNSVKGVFGGGTSGKLDEINEQLAKLENLSTADYSQDMLTQSCEFYKEIFGQEVDMNAIVETMQIQNELQNGGVELADGTMVSAEDLADDLLKQAEDLTKEFNQSVEDQGIITNVASGVGSFFGIGTTKNMTKAQLSEYENQVKQLQKAAQDGDYEAYASCYKTLTGENLSYESLSQLHNGDDKTLNSKANESISDYENTTSNIKNTAVAIGVGAASAATGGLVAGVLIGSVATVGVNALDSATQENCKNAGENLLNYAKTDFLKDFFVGGLNAFTGKIGNIAGEKIVSAFATSNAAKLGAGLAQDVTQEALKKSLNIGQRITSEFVDGAVDAALSSSGEYLISAAAGENGYFLNDQGELAIIENIKENFDINEMGEQVILSTVMGGVMSAGMQEGMAAVGSIISKGKEAVDANIIKNAKVDDYGNTKISMGQNAQFDAFKNGESLPKNLEATVPQGTCVEIGGGKLNLDELKMQSGETVIIGREGDIKIPSDKVSRQHLQVTATDSGYVIKDLGSTNGTKVAFEPLVLEHSDGSITTHKNISVETYNQLFDGCYSNSEQYANGDCYLLTAMNALFENPDGRNIILNCFKETADGKLTVKLPEGKFSKNINEIIKEINKNPEQYSKTNLGIKALEYMYGLERFSTAIDIKAGKIRPFESEFAEYVYGIISSGKEITDEISFREGGWTSEVMAMFGLKTKDIYDSEIGKYLENQNNWKDTVFTIITNPTPEGGGDDTYWYKKLDLAGNHAYLLRPRIEDGKVVADIKNPWHSGKISCTLTLKDLISLGCFSKLTCADVK